jgi:hypothetical protein
VEPDPDNTGAGGRSSGSSSNNPNQALPSLRGIVVLTSSIGQHPADGSLASRGLGFAGLTIVMSVIGGDSARQTWRPIDHQGSSCR